ncbi:hypothetical protein JMJ77_0000234, partial [Colletotrichum scovillei]
AYSAGVASTRLSDTANQKRGRLDRGQAKIRSPRDLDAQTTSQPLYRPPAISRMPYVITREIHLTYRSGILSFPYLLSNCQGFQFPSISASDDSQHQQHDKTINGRHSGLPTCPLLWSFHKSRVGSIAIASSEQRRR